MSSAMPEKKLYITPSTATTMAAHRMAAMTESTGPTFGMKARAQQMMQTRMLQRISVAKMRHLLPNVES